MKRAWGILLVLLIAPLAAQAQGSGWSPPQKINTPTTSNWFPSVAVDPWGKVHLVWSSGKGTGEKAVDLLMYSAKQGDTWRPANDIVQTGFGGWASRNSLAVDRSGRLHLLVRSRDNIYYTSAAANEAWSARGWKPLRKLNGLGQPYYDTIAIDATGVIHAIWSELAPRGNEQSCDGCSDVWYRRSTDGGTTWSAPINLSQGKFGSIKLQLNFDSAGNLYVTWDEGKDPNAVSGAPIDVAFTVSRDQGKTWAAPQRMKLPNSALEQIALAADGAQRLVVVFRATNSDALLFRVSNDQGRTWTDPAPLPGLVARITNDTPWDKYAMATDSAGNVHLLAVARRAATDEVPGLFQVVWNAKEQRWSAPEAVMTNDLYPEWPQLVIANGNQLYATWFTRNKADLHNSDAARYQVWYSTRTVDAPAVAVKIVPTPTTAPTALPTPTVAPPSGQATLPVEAILAPRPDPTRSEAPLMRYLGVALLPPLGLCLAVLAIAVWRRLP